MNCALEFFPDAALAQAKELDEYFEKNKKPIGPLHGLPISLKDQFRVKVSAVNTITEYSLPVLTIKPMLGLRNVHGICLVAGQV